MTFSLASPDMCYEKFQVYPGDVLQVLNSRALNPDQDCFLTVCGIIERTHELCVESLLQPGKKWYTKGIKSGIDLRQSYKVLHSERESKRIKRNSCDESDVLQRMETIGLQEIGCNVTFMVEDQPIKAHSCYLMTCSNYFHQQLSTFKESQTWEFNYSNKYSYQTFKAFRDYLYTGKITIGFDNLLTVCKLATDFQIGKLQLYCAEFLENNLSVDSFIHHAQHLSSLSNDHVLIPVFKSILKKEIESKNWHAPEKLAQLSLSSFELLIKWLPSKGLKLFGLIVAWINDHPNTTQPEKTRLLQQADFNSLTLEQLFSKELALNQYLSAEQLVSYATQIANRKKL